ncbi:transport and Golgi organization protein 2 homolog [Caerostris extrusa]|uniref:Transport and Golgi organization protein 2 homolog n=1 Tax=Caerostris extrusa TaxID=172846 RepID=A0AAV4PTN8_CAEEX|nr:transport and Golgi organization protein 2 homolog [Caerostris extrusa]
MLGQSLKSVLLQEQILKMCLLTFYLNPDAGKHELYLVLVNVRDEIYTRPTQLASFWEKHPHVIGGMDLESGKEGGTWLAMSKKGKIGALLNILQPDEEILPGKKGRGFLAVDYVVDEKNCTTYLEEISSQGVNYNEFLLVTIEFTSLNVPKIACYTNSSSLPPVSLQPGIHAFGNSIEREKPWPKVSKMKEMFTEVVKKYPSVSTKQTLVDELFSLLQDSTRHTVDDNMKRQGKNKSSAFLEKLGAIFVNIPESNYGSRCHTIILIDGSGNVDYMERSRSENLQSEGCDEWHTNHHIFKLGD